MNKLNKTNKETAAVVIKDLALAYIFSLHRAGWVSEDDYLSLKDDIVDAYTNGTYEDILGLANQLIENLESMKKDING